MTTYQTVLEPQRYADIPGVNEGTTVSATVVKMRTQYAGDVRMKFVYTGPEGCSRRVTGGPVLPGPYAAFFPLASVIDNYGATGAERAALQEQGLEFDVVDGDVLVIDGREFTIVEVPYGRTSYPDLVPVEADIPDSDLQAMEEAKSFLAMLAPPKPKRVPVEDIEVGMPATHYVGSDSYAVEVYAVERFKTGAKAGKVKAVITGSRREDGTWGQTQKYDPATGEFYLEDDTDRFLPVEGQPNRLCTRTEGKVAWWSSLAVGYARDYRDPSF